MNSIRDLVEQAQSDSRVDRDALKGRIVDALKSIYDPEIPVNIYDLGLIYRLEVDEQGGVDVAMTLTTPACPVAQTFPATVEETIRGIDGVTAARVELVWDPPWCQDTLSDEVKLQLGLL